MARVPEYKRTEKLNPLHQRDYWVRANANHMGGHAARGLRQAGAGIAQAGNALSDMAGLNAENAAKTAHNAYLDERRELLYNPETGFMSQQGRNAIDGREGFETQLKTLRTKYSEGLSPQATKMFSGAAVASEQQALQRGAMHASKAMVTDTVNTSEARQSTFFNEALAVYSSPQEVDKQIGLGLAEIQSMAELQGHSPSVVAAQKQTYISDVRKGVLMRMAADDPLAANAYFEGSKDQFTGVHQAEITEVLKVPVLHAKAQQNLSEFFNPQNGGRAYAASSPGTVMRAIASAESAGNPTATNTKSTATGLLQFTEGTWLETVKQGRPDIYYGRSRSQILELRSDPDFSMEMGTHYAKRNSSALTRAGVSPTPGNIRLAHFAGGAGAVAVHKANPSAPAAAVLSKASGEKHSAEYLIKVNPHLKGMSAGGLINWASADMSKKMGAGDVMAMINGLSDPKERDATLKLFNSTMTLQNKMNTAREGKAKGYMFEHITKGGTPFDAPIEIQSALGMSGMSGAMEYFDKVQTYGEPQTNDRLMYDLSKEFASDPNAFADRDLYSERPQLSNKDWDTIMGWQRSALTDGKKAQQEALNINAAMKVADVQLKAAGIIKSPSKMEEADLLAVSRFQNGLFEMMREYQATEKKAPSQADILEMTGKLLTPIILDDPNAWMDREEAKLFQAPFRGDFQQVEVNVVYEDIQTQTREAIATDLVAAGLEPTKEAVVERYEQFLMGVDQ